VHLLHRNAHTQVLANHDNGRNAPSDIAPLCPNIYVAKCYAEKPRNES